MFKIATTSFIKKDTRINNALYLQKKVNEIELLYFDSKKSYDFPNKNEIQQLVKIPVDYNIHMPIDMNLNNRKNWQIMHKFAENLKYLNPVTYTIHPAENNTVFIEEIEKFAEKYFPTSIENINNDTEIFDVIINNNNINICFDVGHAILYEIKIYDFLEKYENKISHIHLHGVVKEKDHKSIKYLDKHLLDFIVHFSILKQITLCLEVFNENDFIESLNIIKNAVAEFL